MAIAMFRFTIRDMLWLTLVTAFAVGWWVNSQKLPATAPVSGRITIGGRPVPDGRLLFHALDGQIIGATVKNGEYHVANVSIGSYRIAIVGADVPSCYSEDIAGLMVAIRRGGNTLNFGLR